MLKVKLIKLELEELQKRIQNKVNEDASLKDVYRRLETVISILDCMLITDDNAIIDAGSFINILQENEVYNLYEIVSEMNDDNRFEFIPRLCENY